MIVPNKISLNKVPRYAATINNLFTGLHRPWAPFSMGRGILPAPRELQY